MFAKLKKNRLVGKNNDSVTGNGENTPVSLGEEQDDDNNNDSYVYPSLFEEADEMLQVSLLIYSMTDLRTLAKRKDTKLSNPDKVLSLPLKLGTCLEMIEENIDLIKSEMGDADHEMTISALQSMQERHGGQLASSSSTWLSPILGGAGGGDGDGDLEIHVGPSLVACGDDKPDSDLVYAIGIDPIRKRVTVAFRGSVTTSDFMTDANITLNRRPNPTSDDDDAEQIGIHHGFSEYLLKPRKGGDSKYTEIMNHVRPLFQDAGIRQSYKLYVTGHSLGGALATLFSFFVAATEDDIPKPVTCVSVASPRVGEGQFQSAFRLMEQRGLLRHLRIANDRDPVTVMPTSSSKKIWAMLSPASYIAFKLSDRDFAEKETYQHTGIKLKLRKPGEPFEIAYSSGKQLTREEQSEEDAVNKSSNRNWLSFKQKELPDVVYHFGNTYSENLAGAEDKLQGMSLNELYETQAGTFVRDENAPDE